MQVIIAFAFDLFPAEMNLILNLYPVKFYYFVIRYIL
jgi:hypothetical protein